MKHTLTACTFLILLTLAGCMGKPSQSSSQTTTSEPPEPDPVVKRESTAPADIDPQILAERRFNEAPMLAKRVAAGDLPPVADRLPEDPLIVRPLHEIGRYGGTIRRLLDNESGRTGVNKTLTEHLLGYERPFAHSIQPNLAYAYEYQDEGRTLLFHLRKGIKWSDGQPFTADDVLFWYIDTTLNLEASNSSTPPGGWLIEEQPIKMEKIDDYTIRLTATKPMGRILEVICREPFISPKHYWSPYHPRYNPGATYENFRREASESNAIYKPGVPRLSAWAPTQWTKSQRVVYERNPYYWKVDTAGNQLPYADELTFTFIPDREVMLLRFVNGEFDLFGRFAYFDMANTLRSMEQKTGFFTLHSKEPDGGMMVRLNWDAKNPALREAIRDKRVRLALSYAINREEINQIVFNGAMIPGGFSFTPSSPYYDPESFQRYARFDPEKSKALLEQAGYRDTDGDGWREFKDGSRFDLILDVVLISQFADAAELVVEHWKDIGIRVHMNPCTEEVHLDRRLNGTFESHIWGINGSVDPFEAPHHWAIIRRGTPMWYQSAIDERPDWLMEATNIMNEAATTIDHDRLMEMMGRLREIYTDKIPAIGIGSLRGIWAANKRLGNVPAEGTFDHTFGGWARPVFHEQLYIKNLE